MGTDANQLHDDSPEQIRRRLMVLVQERLLRVANDIGELVDLFGLFDHLTVPTDRRFNEPSAN